MMTYTRSNGITEKTTIAVNGHNLPCPSSMAVSLEDLHGESKRNAAGYLVSDIIRHNVTKIELKWNFLSVTDFNAIVSAFPSSGLFFPVKYTAGNTEKTITAYKGAIGRSVHQLLDTGNVDGYTGVSVNLIER